ncbi:MAG: hypothetical protein RSA24_04700 [Clostridia bacterium]
MNFLIDQPPCPVSDACVNIINSVASMENSLSTILYAEGDKIQKILSISTDASEILSANNSASNMVKDILRLELVLNEKLTTAVNCQNQCDKICCAVDGGIF